MSEEEIKKSILENKVERRKKHLKHLREDSIFSIVFHNKTYFEYFLRQVLIGKVVVSPKNFNKLKNKISILQKELEEMEKELKNLKDFQ